MVKLASSLLVALVAVSAQGSPNLRSLGVDIDLPWAQVHVGDDGVSVQAPFVNVQHPADGPVSVEAPGVSVNGNSVEAPGVSVNGNGPIGTANRPPSECDPSSLASAQSLSSEASCATVLPLFYDGTSDSVYVQQTAVQRVATIDALCSTPCGNKYTDYLNELRAAGCKPLTRVGGGGGGYVAPVSDFPGLLLGCTKAEDGQYCAAKQADPDKDCGFFMTCCYGHYLKGLKNTNKLINKVEDKCPGSKQFAKMTCNA